MERIDGKEPQMPARTADRLPDARSAESRAAYETDLYSWATEQAALLRAGRIGEADVPNIAEEVEDLGREQHNRLESALRLVLSHLLKWDFQPERRSISWVATIRIQRKHAAHVLRKNPGLRLRLPEIIADAYDLARTEASAQTKIEEDRFPADCPYSWGDIAERSIRFEDAPVDDT